MNITPRQKLTHDFLEKRSMLQKPCIGRRGKELPPRKSVTSDSRCAMEPWPFKRPRRPKNRLLLTKIRAESAFLSMSLSHYVPVQVVHTLSVWLNCLN